MKAKEIIVVKEYMVLTNKEIRNLYNFTVFYVEPTKEFADIVIDV
ncbi:MAG: hypothetical protein ACMXX9_01190 [Candidatus Woesearchaeota archaeon]